MAERWRELDPAGFTTSDYARSLPPRPDDIKVAWHFRQAADLSAVADELLASAQARDRMRWIEQITEGWAKEDLAGALRWLSALNSAERQNGLVAATGAARGVTPGVGGPSHFAYVLAGAGLLSVPTPSDRSPHLDRFSARRRLGSGCRQVR